MGKQNFTESGTMSRAKIVKQGSDKPTEVEQKVSQALMELEQNSSDLKPQLRELYIHGAKEIDVGNNKRAMVLFVPVPQKRSWNKIQSSVVRELEKKFSGKHVLIVAQRRILPKETSKQTRKGAQKRPMSRTLTSVHDKILEDLCFPAEIVGKRTRVKLDSSKLIKVHLDKANQNSVEHKTETFVSVTRSSPERMSPLNS